MHWLEGADHSFTCSSRAGGGGRARGSGRSDSRVGTEPANRLTRPLIGRVLLSLCFSVCSVPQLMLGWRSTARHQAQRLVQKQTEKTKQTTAGSAFRRLGVRRPAVKKPGGRPHHVKRPLERDAGLHQRPSKSGASSVIRAARAGGLNGRADLRSGAQSLRARSRSRNPSG